MFHNSFITIGTSRTLSNFIYQGTATGSWIVSIAGPPTVARDKQIIGSNEEFDQLHSYLRI